MKFKNYRNSHNNDSKIYSEDDIWNMPVSQVFGLENEILAQNRQIGIPDVSELQASDNVIWIDSYTRGDGTKVEGHWRSLPDGARYREKQKQVSETGNTTGGAASVQSSKKIDSVMPKVDIEISKGKQKLIDYNNEKNKNYKDARDCMNIALIGPENIQPSKEFKTVQNVSELSQKIGYNIPTDFPTVLYSAESSLANSLNNSDELKRAILNWNKSDNSFMVNFETNQNLFRSLHNTTVINPKISNGYFTGYAYDLYDFKLQFFKNPKVFISNSGAYGLQITKNLKNYYILIPMKIKL